MLVRAFLIVALLLAQRTALAHQLWHLHADAGEPAQQSLCDFHDVLGAVLGAADATPTVHVVVRFADIAVLRVGATYALARRRLSGARDPPSSPE